MSQSPEAKKVWREAQVAWLRKEDAGRPSDNYLGWIAKRIERGEHRREG